LPDRNASRTTFLLTAETAERRGGARGAAPARSLRAAKLDEAVSSKSKLLAEGGPEALRECKELIREVHAARGTTTKLRASTAHRLAR